MRAVLRRFFGPDCDTDAIMEALHQQAETAFQAPPPKKPGLDELIAYLEAQHIPMVVASSSRMASILRHLNNWHMTDHFKALISGEQFSASKPDPEIFLTAAKALGTVPAETLVLEDSYNLSLIHISELTRRTPISYAVFCLKKKKQKQKN